MTFDETKLSSDNNERFNQQASRLVGKIIAERYQVLSLLGSGGMGAVYHVKQIFLDEEFALKVLDISKRPCKNIELMMENLSNSANLKGLTLQNLNFRAEALEYVSSCPNLEFLSLKPKVLSDKTTQALHKFPALASLQIGDALTVRQLLTVLQLTQLRTIGVPASSKKDFREMHLSDPRVHFVDYEPGHKK